MKLIPLSPTDMKFNLATHKIVLNYADVLALGASATGTIALLPTSGTFPVGTTVRFAAMQLITAFDFSDASINSLLMEVGDGNDTDRLLTQTELAVDGTEILGKAEGAVTQPYTYPIVDTVDAKFTAAGGASPTLAEATSGEVHIYLYVTFNTNMNRVKGPLG